LHSGKLEYLGLVAAAKSFSKEISEKYNVEIDFEEEGVPRILRNEVALSLFRILQEALHNAIVHSDAKHFEVRLWTESNEVHLRVKDLGKGFDPLAGMHGEGIGLTSMRERVRMVNGDISIDSRPLCGTTIHVRVPLPEGWLDSVA
jgi:signal transduction histidine kinase